MNLKQQIINLYKKTATELPEDVVFALEKAREEEDNPIAKEALGKILENIQLAKEQSKPLCQDTGIPIFYIKYLKKYSQKELKEIIGEATAEATKEVPLRPNAVDSLTGDNLGNRPVIHFEEGDELKIDLMLKGGGSENVSAIYQLPNEELGAGRDLEGVKKCIIDTVFKAQGKGCPPYVVGVAIGGSIEEVARLSKRQLLRKLDDINYISELDNLEKEILDKVNKLGIGAMGMSGKTTALSVKIINGMRHPASYFVGISIGCWCLRRQSVNF